MKTIQQILTTLILMLSITTNAQMVLEYNIITPNTQIALPLAGSVNVSVDWGDGSAVEVFTTAGNKPHTFTEAGTKTVTITGTVTTYGSISSDVTNARLTKVLSWDGLGITSLSFAFYNSPLLTQVPTSLPAGVTDLSGMFNRASAFNQPLDSWNTAAVTNMERMFYNANAFNQSIGSWNTTAVTNMSNMFKNAYVFNQPIGALNTANVTNMSNMFQYAYAFNQSIGSWNTGAVTNMAEMFWGATAFNQPIGSWNTAAVANMSSMFRSAHVFNKPIDTWNTATVTNMSSMFYNAYAFNQPIGSWNTTAVTRMDNMFYSTNAYNQPFNQPIGAWNIAAVTNMTNMFYGMSLCTDNYDNLLNGWAPQLVKTGVNFNGGSSKYSSASETARATLISKGWTITDAGIGTTAGAKCTTTAMEDESTYATEMVLYPNPAKDKLSIILETPTQEQLTYSIFNTTGQLVLEKEILSTDSSIEIGLEGLQQGAYIVKIQSNENVMMRSFVKE